MIIRSVVLVEHDCFVLLPMFGSENWNHMDARKEGMQQGEERNKEREKEAWSAGSSSSKRFVPAERTQDEYKEVIR